MSTQTASKVLAIFKMRGGRHTHNAAVVENTAVSKRPLVLKIADGETVEIS